MKHFFWQIFFIHKWIQHFLHPNILFKLMSIWLNLNLQSNCLSLDWATAQVQHVLYLNAMLKISQPYILQAISKTNLLSYSLISLLEPSLQATTTVGIFWKSLFWLHQSSLIIPRNAPSQKFLTKTQFWVTKIFFDQSFAGCQQLQRKIWEVLGIYTPCRFW